MNLGVFGAGVGLAKAAAEGSAAGMGRGMAKLMMMASGAGGKLSALMGGVFSQAMGTSLVLSGGGLAMVITLLLGGHAMEGNPSKRDGLSQICQALGEKGPADERSPGSEGDVSANAEDNAKKVYSVLKHAGMNDQNIAGIIGNWDAESGVDPTSIQNIFDEPYKIGPTKQAKLDAGGFATNSTGLGLGQWTGPRAQALLDYAKEKNANWYDIELQLAFMLDENGDSANDVAVVQDMVSGTNEGSDDPGQAALYFHSAWERSADTSAMAARRADAAGKWYARMGSWTVDSGLAKSVLAMAQQVSKKADAKAVISELLDCPLLGATATGGGGNADAAIALVTYAWPYSEQSMGNDGTYLYQYLHDQVYPGDAYYASCDRSVGTAVRWSGTDDTYPPGPVSAQMAYLKGEGASKWEEVGVNLPEDKLKPGDVLLTNDGGGHTFMYVGEEAVKKVWGDDHEPNAVIGSGSLNDRSPGLNNNGELSDGRSFTVFRSKGKEKNSKFVDITAPASKEKGKGPTGGLRTPG